jgi:hypothetical protein
MLPTTGLDNSPLAPLTVTTPLLNTTVTPAGIAMGILPILDIVIYPPQLPYVAKNFATYVGCLCLLTGHFT